MNERMCYGAKLTIAVIILFFLSISASFAGDELVLKGVVRNIDYGSKVVTVDVKSQSCPGRRYFRFNNSSGLSNASIGNSITFRINASRCDTNVLPIILNARY